MFKKKISLIAFLILASSLSVACTKKEEIKEQANPIEKVEVEEPKIYKIEKASFKNLSELKSFSQNQIKSFEGVLKANKIDYVKAGDNSLIINENMTYEKYTKEFNQLAYTQISTNYDSGTGYLKTGLKLNIHLEEQVSTENNFVKAMFDTIKLYNPDYNEEEFNTQIKSATSNPDDLTDKDIITNIEGIVVKVYSNASTNEREIVLSIRQDLELPELKELEKSYKTVLDFKNDSATINETAIQKIERLNEVLKNSYIGKYKDVNVVLKSFESNETTSFNQSIELEYTGSQVTELQDEMLETYYELLELVLTKNNINSLLTKEEFKEYIKGLAVYTGAYTSGSVINELGEAIEPNKLPFLKEVSVSISFNKSQVDEQSTGLNTVESTEDKNANLIKLYDSVLNLKVSIPVKAEGISSL